MTEPREEEELLPVEGSSALRVCDPNAPTSGARRGRGRLQPSMSRGRFQHLRAQVDDRVRLRAAHREADPLFG